MIADDTPICALCCQELDGFDLLLEQLAIGGIWEWRGSTRSIVEAANWLWNGNKKGHRVTKQITRTQPEIFAVTKYEGTMLCAKHAAAAAAPLAKRLQARS